MKKSGTEGNRKELLGVGISIPTGAENPPTGVRATNGSGFICAEGFASEPGNSDLLAVFGKIYHSGAPGPIPPGGATPGSVGAGWHNVNWTFHGNNEIPDARCSGASPYPKNLLAVWALFANGSYLLETTDFKGSCGAATDCNTTPFVQGVLHPRQTIPVILVALVENKTGDYADLPATLDFFWDPVRQWWTCHDLGPARDPLVLYVAKHGPGSGYLLAHSSSMPALMSPDSRQSSFAPVELVFEIVGRGDRLGTHGSFTLTIPIPESNPPQ